MYRLPTEAEWEYACRGGPICRQVRHAFDFYFDKPTNQLLPEQANFEHGKGLKRTCKVGSYKPNRLGLYDMHGNVWEWCDDDASVNPTGPRTGCTGAAAGTTPPGTAGRRSAHGPAVGPDHYLGLRLARVPVGKKGK